MWSMLRNLMARGDDGSGWGRFLPFIVLMVMYGLSSFFKNKPKKPPAPRPGSSPTTPPAKSKPPTRLPSYARKRTATAPEPQPAQARRSVSRPRTSPTPTKPVPRSRPVARDRREALEPPRPKPRMPSPAATQAETAKPVRVLHTRYQHTTKSEPVMVKPITATGRLVKRTGGKGALAQAILYGEILGTPMSLRPTGSHHYTALGSPGISR